MIKLDDKEELLLTLHQYHTMIRGQVELDQFVYGLKTFMLLDLIREPQLMKPLFVSHQGIQLSKGLTFFLCNATAE